MILEEVVMMIAASALAAWVLWLLYKRHELKMRAQAERVAVLSRLIEKAGSAQEVLEFLKSEAGGRLFGESAHESPPRLQLVRFIMGGLVLAMLGAAFLLSARMTAGRLGPAPDINFVREVGEKREWAILFLCLALSLWLVALVYHLAIRRKP